MTRVCECCHGPCPRMELLQVISDDQVNEGRFKLSRYIVHFSDYRDTEMDVGAVGAWCQGWVFRWTLNLAQVNCALYGDMFSLLLFILGLNWLNRWLCRLIQWQQRQRLPSIMLDNFGKLVEVFRGSWLVPNLKDFLHKSLPLSFPPLGSNLGPKSEPGRQGPHPHTIHIWLHPRQGTRINQILRTVVRTLQETGADVGKARKGDGKWIRHNAEVNCEDHGTLCKTHNVEGFPTFSFFGRDGEPTKYQSGRKLELFVQKTGAP